MTYYKYISALFEEIDDFDIIQSEIKKAFKELNSGDWSQQEIVEKLVQWILEQTKDPHSILRRAGLSLLSLCRAVRCSMKFPNKVISYNKSILAKLPVILNELQKGSQSPATLYKNSIRNLYQLRNSQVLLTVCMRLVQLNY